MGSPRKFTDEMLGEVLTAAWTDLPALAAKWGLPLYSLRKKHARSSKDALRVAIKLRLPPLAPGVTPRWQRPLASERDVIEAMRRGGA